MFSITRGESFRKILLRVGELRRLVVRKVNVMALTATATKALRVEVQHIVGMKSPTVIAQTPSRSNIMFIVKSKDSLCQAFTPMMDQLFTAALTVL